MKIIKNIIIIAVLIIEIFFIHLTYKSLENMPSKVDEIKINTPNEISKNNGFAVLIDENNNGVFTESPDRSKWPDESNYHFDSVDCYDELGALTTPNITYTKEKHAVTFTTNKSIFCYLRFAKNSAVIQTLEANNPNNQLETDAARKARTGDVLRRFQSTNKDIIKNNYICFGATSCTDKDEHMYRIIGVVSQADNVTGEQVGMLKIIKQTPLSSTHAWNSSYNVEWNTASLYTDLNSTYFLDTVTGSVGSKKWTDIIATINWRYGDISSSSDYASGTALLTAEKKWTQYTIPTSDNPSKIGLMYLSDYYLAYDNTTNWYDQSGTGNWLLAQNNGSSPVTEWTMSRSAIYYAWQVNNYGRAAWDTFDPPYSIRPVFYLISSVQLRGTGAIKDPYTISAA